MYQVYILCNLVTIVCMCVCVCVCVCVCYSCAATNFSKLMLCFTDDVGSDLCEKGVCFTLSVFHCVCLLVCVCVMCM